MFWNKKKSRITSENAGGSAKTISDDGSSLSANAFRINMGSVDKVGSAVKTSATDFSADAERERSPDKDSMIGVDSVDRKIIRNYLSLIRKDCSREDAKNKLLAMGWPQKIVEEEIRKFSP